MVSLTTVTSRSIEQFYVLTASKSQPYEAKFIKMRCKYNKNERYYFDNIKKMPYDIYENVVTCQFENKRCLKEVE